jgi:hypothetical protein
LVKGVSVGFGGGGTAVRQAVIGRIGRIGRMGRIGRIGRMGRIGRIGRMTCWRFDVTHGLGACYPIRADLHGRVEETAEV